jgi:hypothetical protein
MLDFVFKPLAWLGVVILALVFWWLVLRLLFKAYYRSRYEYYQEFKKEQEKQEER